jgi:uncharacterized protein (DUF433 family)
MGITAIEHIELRANRDGQPRAYIVGTRVRVQDIYFLAEVEGRSPNEIVTALPSLTLGQVHAALSYYFDHRDAVLNEIQQDDAFAVRLREQLGPGPLERKRSQLKAPGDGSVPSG